MKKKDGTDFAGGWFYIESHQEPKGMAQLAICSRKEEGDWDRGSEDKEPGLHKGILLKTHL